MKHPSCIGQLEGLESRTLLASAVKIMPLGDSITESFPGHASYRFFLYNQLVNAGYNVDFVGTNHGVNGGDPLYSNFDSDNEGHSGLRADEIESNVTLWAKVTKPDIVLLHAGSNDLEQGQSNESTVFDIGKIIDDLRSILPKVKILLAQTTTEATHLDQFADLNEKIATLAKQKNTSASPVYLVDQSTGFDPTDDTFDGVHPDESGERKMSQQWFNTLVKILPKPASNAKFLSDLKAASSTNGWGPVELDQSNGEDAPDDGGLLAINGNAYLKGLGMNPDSDVKYNIRNAGYTQFVSDIGVDDDVADAGSVIFKVYVDGKAKYTSPVMTGADGKRTISIPLSKDNRTLQLIATTNGDDGTFDHADWGNARLLTKGAKVSSAPPGSPSQLKAKFDVKGDRVNLSWRDNAKDEAGIRIMRKEGATGAYKTIANLPANATRFSDDDDSLVSGSKYYYKVFAYKSSTINSQTSATASVTLPASKAIYLSDMPFNEVENGSGPVELDTNVGGEEFGDGSQISINGTTYDKGLGTQAPSELMFSLNGAYSRFMSDVGLDDMANEEAAVTFQVFGDGKKLYDSGLVVAGMGKQSINVSVVGVSRLRLVLVPWSDSSESDQADWANARVIS